MAFIDSGKTFDKDENYENMRERMENMDNVQYTLRLPKSLYSKVKLKLAKEDRKFRAVLLEMIEQYVAD